MLNKIAVIGSGFAGLSAAIEAAHQGCEVHVFEKNKDLGGRARKFEVDGFAFDMGPSWYWMPDVFENFFARYNKKVSDYYQLHRLDPSYKVVFPDGTMDIPASIEALKKELDILEPGAGNHFQTFMDDAKIKYEVGMNKFVQKPSHSVMEFAELSIAKDALKLHLFKSFSKYIRKYFKHPRILQLLEFPVLFLGAKPEKTPALYSLMNYADSQLGTWYPMGGMHEIIKGFVSLAKEKDVQFHSSSTVEEILIDKGIANGLRVNGQNHHFDGIIAAADYHHVDQHLIPAAYRMYGENYWNTRTMSPSSMLYYVGVKRKVKGLKHHNLFFDTDFDEHAKLIYDTPSWPKDPLFYVCAPSKTDESVAPEGYENLFFLVPLAPGLKDSEQMRENYLKLILDRIAKQTGDNFENDIVYTRSYAHKEFIEDYNAYKGNAYGLANTLLQTAFLKPKMRSKKVDRLYFAGQLTTPGPGVPPSIISGCIATGELLKEINDKQPAVA